MKLTRILCLLLLVILFPLRAAATDTPVAPLSGSFNTDLNYQNKYTTGVYTYDGAGAVSGQQNTDYGGSICQETVSGTYTFQYQSITVVNMPFSNGTYQVLNGTTHVTVTPVPPAFNCPTSRATHLTLFFRGLVGADCDSATPNTSPFICNETLILTQGSVAYKVVGGPQYAIVGGIDYPDAEDGTVQTIGGYYNPLTYTFSVGYWINRSYSPFVQTGPDILVDPSAVVNPDNRQAAISVHGPWLAPPPAGVLGYNVFLGPDVSSIGY